MEARPASLRESTFPDLAGTNYITADIVRFTVLPLFSVRAAGVEYIIGRFLLFYYFIFFILCYLFIYLFVFLVYLGLENKHYCSKNEITPWPSSCNG